MANHFGTRIQEFETYSEKYPGFLFNSKTNIYRKPFVWVNKQGKKRHGSHRHIEKKCSICGCDMLQEVGNAKKSKASVCSENCKKINRSNPEGFKIKKNGFEDGHVYVKCSDHPHATKTGYVLEHRLAVEKSLGRYLKNTECVHHINLIKNDNRLENLFLFEGNSRHHLAHGSLNKCVAKLMEIGILVFNKETELYEVLC